MQGMLSCSSSRPAVQPAVLPQQGGSFRHGLPISLMTAHKRIVKLPRSSTRYQAVRADSGAANDSLGPFQSIANWWRNITGQGPDPKSTTEAVKETASKAEGDVKQHVSSGKQAVSTAADSASETSPPLKPYPKVATNGQVASINGSKRDESVSTGTQTEPVKPAKGKESAEAASWSQTWAAQREWDDGDQDSKPGLLGYSIVAGLLLMAVLTTSFLVKGIGHVRQSRRVHQQATPAAAQLHQSRKQKRRAEKAENTRLFADTKQEKRLLKDKESIGDPRADAEGSQRIQEAGDFRPWSKAELQTMKEAGDKEAEKLEHDTQAQLPSTQAAKGKRRQQQEMLQQNAENIEAGRPRVWVPGQGWVAIDPDWERQEAPPQQRDTPHQSIEPEQSNRDACHSSSQGYDADSETDCSQQRSEGAERAQSGGSEPADSSELEAGVKEEEGGETTEGKPTQPTYAMSSGYAIRDKGGPVAQQHKSEEDDSADRSAKSCQERIDTEQREGNVSDQDESRQQNLGLELSEVHPEGQQWFDGSHPQNSDHDEQQAEESRSRVTQRERVHERDCSQDEEQQLPPLPCVGQIERPASAVDFATLQLPSDLSVCSLRDRAAVAMRASLAAGEASHRAASYSSAASAAASKAAQAAQSAAQSASYAQRALEAKSKDELEEALLRTARAQAEAEESESRAATAAALATAHQEVSASQADVAEQAADSGAPAHQNFVHSASRRSQAAWYYVRSTGERAGHALMGWVSVLWLWLQQAWHIILGWGHRALHYLNIVWNWVVGFVTHAYARMRQALQH